MLLHVDCYDRESCRILTITITPKLFNTFKFKYLSVPQLTSFFSDILTRPTLRRIGSVLETVVTNQKGGGVAGPSIQCPPPLCQNSAKASE